MINSPTQQLVKEKDSSTPASYSKSRTVVFSSAICALLLFGAINAALSCSSIVKFDRYRYAYRGWPWWIMNDLRQHPVAHNVALLGSSLVVSAAAGCDALFWNRDLDQTTYHDAAFFDDRMSTALGGKIKTIDLAIPGQMPSDAYMALKASMDLGQRPKLVIYGIAPRDFIDSTLGSPLDTDTYHYLSRLVDIEPLAPELFKEPQRRLNRELEKSVFLYGHSLDCSIANGDYWNAVLDRIVPTPQTDHAFTYWDRLKLLPDYHKLEIYPTAMIASPKEQTFSEARFTDNTKDYIDRYKKPRPEIFKMQLFFLEQLSKLCESNGAKLILVNMPITEKNVKLLGDQRYRDYLATIDKFSAEQKVNFFDLNDFSKYSIQDFHDLVHLNGTGATKFFSDLSSSLTTDPRTASLCRAISKQELPRKLGVQH